MCLRLFLWPSPPFISSVLHNALFPCVVYCCKQRPRTQKKCMIRRGSGLLCLSRIKVSCLILKEMDKEENRSTSPFFCLWEVIVITNPTRETFSTPHWYRDAPLTIANPYPSCPYYSLSTCVQSSPIGRLKPEPFFFFANFAGWVLIFCRGWVSIILITVSMMEVKSALT